MVKALALAAVAWPALLSAATWQRASGEMGVSAVAVYYAASHVCHQQPARTFHTADTPWPVCARCAGLYLAAPFGALLALGRRRPMRGARFALALASLPTVVTIAVEWLDVASVSNLARFLAALPLGAVVAFVVVRTAAGRPQAIGYTAGS